MARIASARAELASLTDSSRDANSDDEHDPDGATIAFERAQVAALARSAESRLEQVDQALARLDAATYGVCERCGRRIPAGRLAARPTARTCVDCAGG
ncbi:TraR/DksA family transcriptional regulator [Georgenia sp. TF02-10]|nr:TraR/DksA C4-type zinc finger protein [Georgenia sp. TF02-10]UNX56440.1 TraR/DksA family transcriptional regulator [Georgenia sp. TF02-10]